MRAYLTKEEKIERAELIERNETYAKRERLEIVFSAGHRYYQVIYYDVAEGKYYNRSTDMTEENVVRFGLGA